VQLRLHQDTSAPKNHPSFTESAPIFNGLARTFYVIIQLPKSHRISAATAAFAPTISE
jgi:hypothetical protein